MGDSACVVHAFSYASPIPNEAKQGNPMHALGESISFGRYMSDSLAWEKWSTFSNKRYVEEAASYAQPGSVAQKKAFFEAHYKRIAARKAAAALLEQANAVDNATDPEADSVAGDNNIAGDSQATNLDTQVEIKNQDHKADFSVKNYEHKSIAQQVESESDNVEKANLVAETEAAVETPMRNGSPNSIDKTESQKEGTESELSGTSQMEKPLLKKSSSSKEVSSVTSKKKPSAYHNKASKIPSPPARPNTPGHLRKAKNATPVITRKPISDSMKENRSPPKSLRTLMNSSSTKEPDKPPAPAKQKMESSRVAPTAVEPSKYCSTPLRTPLQATPSRMSKQPPVTPRTEDRRTKTLIDPSGSKTTGPKWHILSAVSKSLTACRNKLQSPTLSTPFLLRTEERAARRKQKLEEKFTAKEEEKVQLQTKLKEKAETEIRKLRQSFCFKARPLPHFYKQKETTKSQTNKAPMAHPQSPKLGRKPSGSKLQQGTISLPPQTLSQTKKDGSKNASKKNGRSAINSHASKPNVTTAHENTSPNIQH